MKRSAGAWSAWAGAAAAVLIAGLVLVPPATASGPYTWQSPQRVGSSTAQSGQEWQLAALSADGSTAVRGYLKQGYAEVILAAADLTGNTPDYGTAVSVAGLNDSGGSLYLDTVKIAINDDGSRIVAAQVAQSAVSPYPYILRILPGTIDDTVITWGTSATVNVVDYVNSMNLYLASDGSFGSVVAQDYGDMSIYSLPFTTDGSSVTAGAVETIGQGTNNTTVQAAGTPDGDTMFVAWTYAGVLPTQANPANPGYQVRAASGARSGSGYSWTAMDNLSPPSGYYWANFSSSYRDDPMRISSDGTTGALGLSAGTLDPSFLSPSPVGSRPVVFSVDLTAGSGSQWSSGVFLSPNPWTSSGGTTASPAVSLSADGSLVSASALDGSSSGVFGYLITGLVDGNQLTLGDRVVLNGPSGIGGVNRFDTGVVNLDSGLSATGQSGLLTLQGTLPSTSRATYAYDFAVDDTTGAGRGDVTMSSAIVLLDDTVNSPTVNGAFVSNDGARAMATFAPTSWGGQTWSAWWAFTAGQPEYGPLSITTTSVPDGTARTPYSQALASSGGFGARTWTVSAGSLPAGLTLSSGGVISGTPTSGGTSAFTVRAVDAVGNVATQPLQLSVTAAPDPVQPPSAPRDVTAVAGDRSAAVSWREPLSSGSFPISTYRATSTPGGKSCLIAAPTLTCTVSGLSNGTTYTFMVEALNGAGWGPAGGPSAPVTPGGVTPAPEPQPLPAPLPPGESLLQVNGQVDPNVQVDPNQQDNGLQITGDGWSMDLDGLGPDGKPLNLGPDGSLRLANERDVATEGTGFLANSEVDLYVDPPVQAAPTMRVAAQGIYVGTVRTNGQGSFSGTATLPADIVPGDHVLQAVGYSPARQSRAMSLGVIVEPWIVLDQGKRVADGRHDRIRTTGSTGGIEEGTRLTPWIRYSNRSQFEQGKATIVVQADGTFRWTRAIIKNRGVTAYVAYRDIESNRVVWVKIR